MKSFWGCGMGMGSVLFLVVSSDQYGSKRSFLVVFVVAVVVSLELACAGRCWYGCLSGQVRRRN